MNSKHVLILFNISFTLSLCGFSMIMQFHFVVGIVLTHNVTTLLYICHCCVLGKNQGRNLYCFFFFLFFYLAYNTTVRFEDLKKLAPLEILASYPWRGTRKSLCLRADFLLQVKRLIPLRQKVRSFLFFSLLLIIRYFCSYHFPLLIFT